MANAALTVIAASEVLPRLSVTRTEALSALAGATYWPVVRPIVPVPATEVYEYGATPPLAVKVFGLLTARTKVEGEIASAALTVTEASAVLPKLSVTRTVADPALPGAV